MSDGIVTPANPRDPMPRFDLKRYGGSAQWHAALAPWVIRQLDQIRGKHSFLAGVFDTVAFHAKKENIPSEQVSQTGNFEEPMYLRQIRQSFVMHNPGDMFELTFKEMEDLLDWAEAVRMSANRDDEPQSVSEEQKSGFICAKWKKLSDGCVARCDKDHGHDGDHLDSVILIGWSEAFKEEL